jgi:murein DD-endopeptidase MepM/ murein hydrolase activator NlpD
MASHLPFFLLLVLCVMSFAHLPVPGKPVTTPFGKAGSWAAGYHTGDDYACPTGTSVRATASGVVKDLNWGADYGIHIVIESPDKVRELYAHLSKKLVKVGQTVKAGEEIAKSGNTGRSTGPHLHYEERVASYKYANHRKPQLNKLH